MSIGRLGFQRSSLPTSSPGWRRGAQIPMQRDRNLDDVMNVAPINQVEEAITLEHVDHLRLHPGEIQVDVVADAVVETTTTIIDVDGDGVADIVQETTITAIHVDGDGEVDIIDETTITAVDLDGDGEFSEDEIEIEETTAVREDLLDD